MGILRNILDPVSGVVVPTIINGDYTIKPGDQRIEVDATVADVIITLPAITSQFQNRPDITIKRIDDNLSTIVRVSGTDGNFEEDDGFTPFDNTVSKTGVQQLTANADVSSYIRSGDSIQVSIDDVFTVDSVSGAIITTNENVIESYSNDTLRVGGIVLGDDIRLEAITIYASVNSWRSL